MNVVVVVVVVAVAVVGLGYPSDKRTKAEFAEMRQEAGESVDI